MDMNKLKEAVAYYDKMEGHDAWSFNLRLLIEHARDSLPKTKMVECWHLCFAKRRHVGAVWEPEVMPMWEGEAEARQEAANMEGDELYACIRVTGPHQQEVPAYHTL